MQTRHDDLELIFRESTRPLPVETQELSLKLHQRLIDFGFKCEMTTRRFGTPGHFFLYSCSKGVHKRKNIEDIWVIKVMPDDCAIRFNAKNADKYADFIENLPSPLLHIIKTGDGCLHNPRPEKCQIDKHGAVFTINGKQYTKCNTKCCAACDFWIPLTNTTNEVSQAIEDWIDMELFYS